MIPGFKKDVVLSTGPLGGLGDLSLYTTLPERFTAEGHNVLAHEDNTARNEEILELLWAKNPFIVGTTDKTPAAGYPLQGRLYDMLNKFPLGSNIEVVERVHGFGPPYNISPRLYYKPQPYHADLSSVILMDMHALSSAIAPAGWHAFHQKVVDRFGGENIHGLTFPASVVAPLPLPPGARTLGVNSIFEYVDMLAACRAWIGSEAGGQALAAAVRGEHDVYELDARPEIVSLMTVGTFNSRAFCFRGVDYRTSMFSHGSDYLDPVEVPYHRYAEICRVNIAAKRDGWKAANGR